MAIDAGAQASVAARLAAAGVDPRAPLIVLHGAYMTVDAMGSFLPGLAETRRVIVPEMQGHGRTADIDRPLSYAQMALGAPEDRDLATKALQDMGMTNVAHIDGGFTAVRPLVR